MLKYFSDFTERQLKQFKDLEGLYKEWNNKINVISRKDIDNLYEKHVLHSLSIAAVFDFEPGTTIIDIGTGGGFPGIPLAIFFPECTFHLIDSIAKKIKVVDAIAESIHLKNITTQHIRAEEIKDRKFDFVVSRAVAPLKELWNWSKPLISLKSGVRHRLRQAFGDRRSQESIVFTTHDSRLTAHENGLICLKGGDLTKEIQESGTRPRIIEIADIFPEDYFKDKFVLYVPVK